MFSLKNVSYIYGEAKDALASGVRIETLDIAPTGVTAIIGPSGSGKTTLLSILAGFVVPVVATGGHFSFDGRAVPPSGHPVGRVAFVFQTHMLLGGGSALVNALIGDVVSGKTERQQGESLADRIADLGLAGRSPSLMIRRARLLSGGEAQRVAILRALHADPEAILCDEPTSSLDEHNADLAMGALKRWARDKDRPVVWVTHNIEQAAKFADHFVFIRQGRVVEIAAADRSALSGTTGAERHDHLRRVVQSLKAVDPPPDDASTLTKGFRTTRVGRLRYAGWIANALSTDSPMAAGLEYRYPALSQPAGVTAIAETMGEDIGRKAGTFMRRAGSILSYSRYGLGIVLTVLLVQLIASDFFGRMAGAYAENRLQDPAVARMVFDHSVFSDARSGGVVPEDLYAETTIPVLEERLRAAIAQVAPTADLGRVKVFGRRDVTGSTLRLIGGTGNCNRPADFVTVALDRDDPILLQTRLAQGVGAPLGRIGDVLARPPSSGFDGVRPGVLLTEAAVKQIVLACGYAPDEPILAEWAAGAGGQLDPIEVEVIGAVAEFPPLHPLPAQMIVLEEDYQRAIQLMESAVAGPLRVASAYFPIEGFDEVEATLRDQGYQIQDNSRAAVQLLQTIARAAKVAPKAVNAANLLGCFIVVLLVIDALLALNRRVLALYIAFGFRFGQILTVLLVHLVPAFAFACVFGWLLVEASWQLVLPVLPDVGGGVAGMKAAAEVRAMGLLVATGSLSTLLAAFLWWRNVRLNLKMHLQE